MNYHNKIFFQNFLEPFLIPSQSRGIMVLIRKSCPYTLNCHRKVTPNYLAVKLTSASKQELEIAFDKNLKAAVTHLAENGCANQLIIGDYNSSMNTDLDFVGYAQDPDHVSREFLFEVQEDNAVLIV